jgi:hypothetical protein
MGQITAFNLQDFIDDYGIKLYFETGTGEGISLEYALKYKFDKLYSVDIDGELITNAKNKFQNNQNVELIHDYSTNAIKTYLPTIDKESPIFFFLDAHFPGADFHKISYEESIREFKKDAFPLEDELNSIVKNRDTSKDVFIIDDFILYEPEGDYETIKHGVVWKYNWLQEELDLVTNSKFIYDLFRDTHDFVKDIRHQGYLIIKPKKNEI